MKVLILQGSPRVNGNTAWMAEEYKKAAEAAGHEVTLVNVAKKKIAGCLACEYCHNKGNGACIQKDDMQELYPLMNEADALLPWPLSFCRTAWFLTRHSWTTFALLLVAKLLLNLIFNIEETAQLVSIQNLC